MANPRASVKLGIHFPEEVIAIAADFDFEILTVVDERTGKEYDYHLVPHPDSEYLPADVAPPERVVIPAADAFSGGAS